jgi:hypothetical protein
VEVRLESPHAERQFREAPREVQKALRRKAQEVAADPQLGTFVAMTRVPRSTRQKWERRVGPVQNLYKLDLPGAWRALYTIGSDGPLRVVLVLEVLRHKEYERVLGYS